jgi:hypothetical protein
MKKLMLLFIKILLASFIIAQVTVPTVTAKSQRIVKRISEGINGKPTVEYGKSEDYTFSFSPAYIDDENGYLIKSWEVDVTNSLNGQVESKITENGVFKAPSYFLFNPTVNDLLLGIQWGDFFNNGISNITANVTGSYTINGVISRDFYKSYNKSINLNRICAPNLSSTSFLKCCNQPITVTANNACNANIYEWTVSGGTPSGPITTNVNSFNIIPSSPIDGDITVECGVKRSQTSPNYFRSSTKTFIRQDRTVNFSTKPSFICKGLDSQYKIDNQCGMTNVTWDVPNGVVTPNTNDSKDVTITTNSNVSSLTVTATANYAGSCTAVVSQTLPVYNPVATPAPKGQVILTPHSGNICRPDGWSAHFKSSTPFTDGITTILPKVLPPHDRGRPRYFRVCNTNLCTKASNCTSIYGYPPAPCK